MRRPGAVGGAGESGAGGLAGCVARGCVPEGVRAVWDA